MDNQQAQENLDNSEAQGNEQATGKETQDVQSVDWVGSLPADHQSVVKIKGWKTPSDAIKSYGELEKLVGHDKIAAPKKDAKGNYLPGEFDRVMTQLGRPKDAKEYKESESFKLPDGMVLDQKFMDEFKAEAHKAGLLPSQYAFVMDQLAKTIQQGTQLQTEQTQKKHNEAVVNLRTRWGQAYESKVKLANDMLANFTNKETAVEVIKKYGDDPAIIELLGNIGANFSEDTLMRNNMAVTMLTPDQARQEIQKVRSDNHVALMDNMHPQHKYWVDKLDELYRMANSSGR